MKKGKTAITLSILLPSLSAENNQNEQIVELLLDDSFCNLKIASGKIDGLASDTWCLH